MSWKFTSAIDIGNRSEQQDRVAILHSENTTHLLIVADGMGGHEDGALAAQTVIDVATRHFHNDDFSNPGEALEKICLDAHQTISKLSHKSASAPGSTCVLLYLTDSEAYWAHIGDSRLYQFSNNRCMFKTTDHSMIELMETQNELPEQDAATQNQLYMCLGGSNDVVAEVMGISINPGDQFLLCSDGLWGQLDVEASLLANNGDFDQSFADQLVKTSRNQADGKSDNICLAWASRQEPSMQEKSNWIRRLFKFFQ